MSRASIYLSICQYLILFKIDIKTHNTLFNLQKSELIFFFWKFFAVLCTSESVPRFPKWVEIHFEWALSLGPSIFKPFFSFLTIQGADVNIKTKYFFNFNASKLFKQEKLNFPAPKWLCKHDNLGRKKLLHMYVLEIIWLYHCSVNVSRRSYEKIK